MREYGAFLPRTRRSLRPPAIRNVASSVHPRFSSRGSEGFFLQVGAANTGPSRGGSLRPRQPGRNPRCLYEKTCAPRRKATIPSAQRTRDGWSSAWRKRSSRPRPRQALDLLPEALDAQRRRLFDVGDTAFRAGSAPLHGSGSQMRLARLLQPAAAGGNEAAGREAELTGGAAGFREPAPTAGGSRRRRAERRKASRHRSGRSGAVFARVLIGRDEGRG